MKAHVKEAYSIYKREPIGARYRQGRKSRSVPLDLAIRRGWHGEEELSAPLKSVGTVCN